MQALIFFLKKETHKKIPGTTSNKPGHTWHLYEIHPALCSAGVSGQCHLKVRLMSHPLFTKGRNIASSQDKS